MSSFPHARMRPRPPARRTAWRAALFLALWSPAGSAEVNSGPPVYDLTAFADADSNSGTDSASGSVYGPLIDQAFASRQDPLGGESEARVEIIVETADSDTFEVDLISSVSVSSPLLPGEARVSADLWRRIIVTETEADLYLTGSLDRATVRIIEVTDIGDFEFASFTSFDGVETVTLFPFEPQFSSFRLEIEFHDEVVADQVLSGPLSSARSNEILASFDPAVVPEPATLPSLLLGAGAIALGRSRRRSTARRTTCRGTAERASR